MIRERHASSTRPRAARSCRAKSAGSHAGHRQHPLSRRRLDRQRARPRRTSRSASSESATTAAGARVAAASLSAAPRRPLGRPAFRVTTTSLARRSAVDRLAPRAGGSTRVPRSTVRAHQHHVRHRAPPGGAGRHRRAPPRRTLRRGRRRRRARGRARHHGDARVKTAVHRRLVVAVPPQHDRGPGAARDAAPRDPCAATGVFPVPPTERFPTLDRRERTACTWQHPAVVERVARRDTPRDRATASGPQRRAQPLARAPVPYQSRSAVVIARSLVCRRSARHQRRSQLRRRGLRRRVAADPRDRDRARCSARHTRQTASGSGTGPSCAAARRGPPPRRGRRPAPRRRARDQRPRREHVPRAARAVRRHPHSPCPAAARGRAPEQRPRPARRSTRAPSESQRARDPRDDLTIRVRADEHRHPFTRCCHNGEHFAVPERQSRPACRRRAGTQSKPARVPLAHRHVRASTRTQHDRPARRQRRSGTTRPASRRAHSPSGVTAAARPPSRPPARQRPACRVARAPPPAPRASRRPARRCRAIQQRRQRVGHRRRPQRVLHELPRHLPSRPPR